MSSSLPVAKAIRRGHCKALWSPRVKHAEHTLSTLPAADDPEAGGSAVPFASNFCFFLAGVEEEDEDALEEEVDDDDRWLLLTGVAIRT